MRHRVLATLIHEVEVDRGYHIDAHHCAHAARTASNKTVSGFPCRGSRVHLAFSGHVPLCGDQGMRLYYVKRSKNATSKFTDLIRRFLRQISLQKPAQQMLTLRARLLQMMNHRRTLITFAVTKSLLRRGRWPHSRRNDQDWRPVHNWTRMKRRTNNRAEQHLLKSHIDTKKRKICCQPLD